MSKDPYKYFRIEARELQEQLAQGFLDLEASASPDSFRRLLRLAHTLKGAARVVKERAIADHAHRIEGALAPLAEAGAAVPRHRVSELLEHLGAIGERLAALDPPGQEARAIADEGLRTVRAEVGEMDALLEGLAEAHVELVALRRHLGAVERARHTADLLSDQLVGPRGVESALARDLRGLMAALERGLGAGLDRVEREQREVLMAAERLRLVPAGALFSPLELAARDAAETLGKRVLFAGKGGAVRLDAHVLATVAGALQQMVRNAVVHGLEAENERRTAGKPPAGSVTVEVERRGTRVAFLCRDDGRGIDLEAMRQVARSKGLLNETTPDLEGEDLLRVLLRGGLSTAASVSEMSGRGVGLDIVRTAASALGGEVLAETSAGKGTVLSLVVPVALSALQALVVEAAGVTVAVPLAAVEETVRILARDLIGGAHGQTLIVAGRAVAFCALGDLLGFRPAGARPARSWSACVLGGASPVALGVDRVVGVVSLILRPLPSSAGASPLVAGAFLDADGDPRLVLDPIALATAAGRAQPQVGTEPAPRSPILVVDDSLTTRMLEQSVLESAGYEVDLAISAEEALGKARGRRYGLFLVDVEMPGMDGFELIKTIRADPLLRGIPAILVTSRSSPDDRRRGAEVGADGFVVKSEFDQTDLLHRIDRLVA